VFESVDVENRSGGDSGISDIFDDDENVELEKSNVLLMGPTGSGIAFITTS
jgi:ATP-dependent Clp protease ATP-binding subunit ClpX